MGDIGWIVTTNDYSTSFKPSKKFTWVLFSLQFFYIWKNTYIVTTCFWRLVMKEINHFPFLRFKVAQSFEILVFFFALSLHLLSCFNVFFVTLNITTSRTTAQYWQWFLDFFSSADCDVGSFFIMSLLCRPVLLNLNFGKETILSTYVYLLSSFAYARPSRKLFCFCN